MRTVSIFKNGANQAIRIPKDMEYAVGTTLEVHKEGDTLVLRPVKPSWASLREEVAPEPDFLSEREDVVSDEGRFIL